MTWRDRIFMLVLILVLAAGILQPQSYLLAALSLLGLLGVVLFWCELEVRGGDSNGGDSSGGERQ